MTIETELPDLRYTCSSIRLEDQTKQFRHEIVELCACTRIVELGTSSTRPDLFFNTARAHLAPSNFGIFEAPFTLPFQEGFASTTIEPATGNLLYIHLNF